MSKGITGLRIFEDDLNTQQIIKNYGIYYYIQRVFDIQFMFDIQSDVFLRLAFVRRVTKEHPILGVDHYYIINNTM